MKEDKRTMIGFSEIMRSRIEEEAKVSEMSKSMIIRNALGLYLYVRDELKDTNKKLAIVKDGEVKEIILLG